MNFKKSLIETMKDLHTYSTTDIKLLSIKYNIPFVNKDQSINVLAFELLKEPFHKTGTMKNEPKLLKLLSDKIGQDTTKYILYKYLQSTNDITTAIQNNDLTTIIIMLESGISINLALMIASKIGNINIVKYLVDNGANIYFENKFKETALIYAFENNNLDVLKYLVEQSPKNKKKYAQELFKNAVYNNAYGYK